MAKTRKNQETTEANMPNEIQVASKAILQKSCYALKIKKNSLINYNQYVAIFLLLGGRGRGSSGHGRGRGRGGSSHERGSGRGQDHVKTNQPVESAVSTTIKAKAGNVFGLFINFYKLIFSLKNLLIGIWHLFYPGGRNKKKVLVESDTLIQEVAAGNELNLDIIFIHYKF
jgi:hypothetical protein